MNWHYPPPVLVDTKHIHDPPSTDLGADQFYVHCNGQVWGSQLVTPLGGLLIRPSYRVFDSKKMKIGELYEKWQKKTNRSIGRVGVFDDVTDDTDVGAVITKKTQREVTNNGKITDDVKKTAVAIRKEREKKENLRKKNMRKEDRRIIERKERADKLAADNKKKGLQGKKSKGKIGRWKNARK